VQFSLASCYSVLIPNVFVIALSADTFELCLFVLQQKALKLIYVLETFNQQITELRTKSVKTFLPNKINSPQKLK
jgi:hypothetical protein